MKTKHSYTLLALLAFASQCLAGTRDLREDSTYASSPGPIIVGPFVDGTGLALTSLAVGSIDITAYRNDGTAVTITPAASGSNNDMIHVDDGYYSLELTSTDTGTPGYLRLTFQISNALIFHEDFDILPANIYDSRYGSDLLQVDAKEVSSSAPAANELAETFDNDGAGGDMDLSSLSVTGTSTYTGNVALLNGLTVTRSTADLPAISATSSGSTVQE